MTANSMPGSFHVLAIGRLAGRDVEQVDDGDVALADIAERARLLELQRVERGRRQSRGIGREFAIAELLARRRVHDFVEARLDLVGVDAPALGSGGLEHLACPGTHLPHGLDEVAHAARAVGILVAVGLLVARRLDHAHARPIGIKLVGDDHRQAGARGAVTHFSPMRNNGDDTVLVDRNEDVRVGHHAMRHLVGAGSIGHGGANRWKLRSEDEHAGASHALEQAAAADIGDDDVLLVTMVGHVRPPLRRRERPYGCADSNRIGRCCQAWRRRFAYRSAPVFSPATQPPA